METAHFLLRSSHPYPVRKCETCPEAKRVCSKAKPDELFGFRLANVATSRMLHSVKFGILPKICGRPEVDVSLDGAETKSEDCQRDVCKNGLLQLERPASDCALKLRSMSVEVDVVAP